MIPECSYKYRCVTLKDRGTIVRGRQTCVPFWKESGAVVELIPRVTRERQRRSKQGNRTFGGKIGRKMNKLITFSPPNSLRLSLEVQSPGMKEMLGRTNSRLIWSPHCLEGTLSLLEQTSKQTRAPSLVLARGARPREDLTLLGC